MKKIGILINTKDVKGHINPEIYGHFSEHLGRCVYNGIYVGEDSTIPNVRGIRKDIVEAFRKIKMPVLRWPGGCFADEYHWKDGIGEKSKRKKMINTNWGHVTEDNSFGTHEYFDLCEQVGCQPYLAGNLGSGTVQELAEWVEYCTFDGVSPMANLRKENGREKPWKLKYFGVGNENWGCGGNMRPEFYADQYKRYATFIRNYGEEPIFRIAGGPNVDDSRWMETLMQNIRHMTDGISLHNYTFENNWNNKGDSLVYDEKGWYSLMRDALRMERIVNLHCAIMDRYDPEKRIKLIVDEWGNWFDVMPGTNPGFLYQQNTICDAVSAVLILHIFHNHCDRISMANIAQMINVLQAVILTEGEKMVLTPTYHMFKMLSSHQDSNLLDVDYSAGEAGTDDIKLPKISVSATEKDGTITVSMCNISTTDAEEIEIDLRDAEFTAVSGEVMTADSITAHNDFDAPENVKPTALDVSVNNGKITAKLPAMSVAVINIK